MLRSVALLQRNAGRTAILSFAVAFAAACGGGTVADRTAAASASSAPSLGTASSFAVLAGPAVTCTGSTQPTVITGDVGVFSPINTGVTLTNCTVTGAIHTVDPAAVQAGTDFFAAYDALATAPCDQTILTEAFTGNLPPLGPLAPGVYCFPAAVTFTDTTLTLSGPSTGIWIFRVGTNPTGTGALTGTNFSVVMAGGGQPCNVYWRVAEGVTMSTSNFVGSILAGAAITISGPAAAPGSFVGRALAKAAVTLTDVNLLGCLGGGGGGGGHHKDHCNQGVGNGPEDCDPGDSNHHNPSNDENGGTPGDPGRKH